VCSKNPRRSPSSKQSSERITLFVAEEIDPEEAAQDEGGGAEISS
jgi:hypothetical protein